jgi:hypothetical protein
MLPPVATFHRVERFLDGGSSVVYSVRESEDWDSLEVLFVNLS